MSVDKTTKIRKHINRFSAVLNYACADFDFDKRNPFARLIIKSGGEDYHKRGTFTNEHLKWRYYDALASGSQI